MSLALHPVRSTLLSLSFLIQRPAALWPIFRPTALWTPFHLAIPSLQSLLELLPPIVWAVPKKKVSHSRKAMRGANKGLKDKTNIVNCPACGSTKLAHHLCPNCYSQISRAYKREAREIEASKPQGQIQRHRPGVIVPNNRVRSLVPSKIDIA